MYDRARRRYDVDKQRLAVRRFPKLVDFVDDDANLVNPDAFYAYLAEMSRLELECDRQELLNDKELPQQARTS
eukprot:3860072-Pyramimonas_sp.AAC.1